MIDLSGTAFAEIELGGVTASTSGGFCLVANMKNVSKRNATSHIAVMSIFVLLRGILTFGMLNIFYKVFYFMMQNLPASINYL